MNLSSPTSSNPSLAPPPKKITDYKIFNYILKLLHTGCQRAELPIEKGDDCRPEIHYSHIYRKLRFWSWHGCFDRIFESTVFRLDELGLLDISILHGDVTSTTAKKGGENLGFNGHQHMKGDKVVAVCDRNCNLIAPFIAVPGNHNECPLLPEAMKSLKLGNKCRPPDRNRLE